MPGHEDSLRDGRGAQPEMADTRRAHAQHRRERDNKFVEMLGESLPKVVEQVFVITHDNELKQISAARIYQLERDKDKNGYTKVVSSDSSD